MTEVRRLISPVVSNFPWYTAAVMQYDDFTALEEWQPFETFLKHLEQYESRLLNLGGCSESVMEMQRLLRLGTGNGTQLVRVSAPSRGLKSREATKLCGLVCAYRLLDVVALSRGHISNAIRVERAPPGVDIKLHAMDKLGNWPSAVQNFGKLMNRQMVKAPDKLSDTSSPATVRLFNLLACNENSQGYSKIEGNFLVAAVHIACMKEFAFARDNFPDIPEDFAEHLRRSTPHQQGLQDVSALMKNTAQAVTDSNDALPLLRAPLQLALLISPIYLLLPMQLYKRSWSRESILLIAQALGNRKPAVIVEVEKAIWRAIFSLVDGPLHPVQLLSQLYNELPWDEINSAEHTQDGGWFDLTRNIHISEPKGTYTAGMDISPHMVDESNSGDLSSVVTMDICPADAPTTETLNPPEEYGQSSASVRAANPLVQDVPGIDPSLASQPFTTHDSSPSLTGMAMDQDAIVDEGRAVECVDERMQDGKEGPLSRSPYLSSSGREEHMDHDMDEHGVDEPDATANPTPSSTVLRTQHEKAVVLPDEPHRRSKRSRRREISPEIESGEAGGPRSGADLSWGSTHLKKTPSRNKSRRPVLVAESQKRTRFASAGKAVHPKRQVAGLTTLKTPLEAGESRENAINLEVYFLTVETKDKIFPCISSTEGDFNRSVPKKYKLDCSLNMWDVRGAQIQKSFEVHHKADARKLQKIIEAVNESYIDGRARHVEVPEESVFRILSYSDYKSLGPKGLADILKRQHIVVKDMPQESEKRFGFDEEGLRTLSPLHAKIDMQDLSLPLGIEGTARLVSGTVAELLQVSQDTNGRVLNALEFPFRARGPEQPPCSVDFVAWEVAAEMSHEDNMEGFPFPHTRWGLAGLRGAFTFWHLDSDGFNTFVDVKNEEGEKWWIVADADRVCSSRLRLLLDKSFDLETGPSDLPLEAILLTKGTRLIMRANTLHAVLTPEHTICHGGHFYCTTTMQATAAGLIHAFVCHNFITNTSHPPSWQLLSRILCFFHQGLVQQLFSTSSSEFTHLPQLPSSKGENASLDEVLILLSLCNLHMLANALNSGTYLDDVSPDKHTANTNFDFNNISFQQRRSIWRCRGVCIDIFRWFRQHYTVRKQGMEVDLVSLYLVHQASAILRYKREVDRRKHPSLDGCTVAKLTKQIDAALEVDHMTYRLWIECLAKQEDRGLNSPLLLEESLLLQDIDRYEVICRAPLEVRKNSYFENVLTRLDRQYLTGRKWTVEVEKGALASFTAEDLE